MNAKRVTVGRHAGEKKWVSIPADMTFDEFLQVCSQKLDISARRAFTESGAEVQELDVVRDEDMLILTEGGTPGGEEKKKKEGVQSMRIAVIGSGGVGKSAITIQYVQGRFVMQYDPTIEDAYRKQTRVDDKACFLEILDTAGQEDYVALRSQWLQEKDGFVVVYAINNRATFDELETFRTHILRLYDTMPPLVLLANKCDLENEREVSRFEGQKLAETWGSNVAFFESSAKANVNIDKAFEALVREHRKLHSTPTRRMFCSIL